MKKELPAGDTGARSVAPLLERLLARREDAADLEVEVVGVGRRFPRGLVRDDPVPVELQQALVEGLHAVLRLALGDERRDLGRPLRLADAVLDRAGADEHLDGRDPALAADLRDERAGETMPTMTAASWSRICCSWCGGNVPMMRLTVSLAFSVWSVEKHEVARLRGVQRDRHRLRVAHFADENDVGSSRSAARSAVAKLGESWPISRWLTTQPMSSWVNSIGSSIVMMWSFRVRLM